MNWTEYPGLQKLRFNKDVKGFDEMMSQLWSIPEQVVDSGKKVIAGVSLSPLEPVYATGAIAYDPFAYETLFHAVANQNFDMRENAVEAGLSPDFSLWNLISTGAVASRKNLVPVNAFSAMCGCSDDQAKKALQAMASAVELPVHFWEIPRWMPEADGWAIEFIVKELKQLFDWLASVTGQKISDEALTEAIRTCNLLRHDMLEITKLQQSSPALLPSLEYYILQSTAGDYLGDVDAWHRCYQSLVTQLTGEVQQGEAKTFVNSPEKLRIFWVGENTLEYQIFNVLDDCGARLVGSDTRFSLFYEPVPEDGNPVESLARWMWNMPCNLPTIKRVQKTVAHIRAQNADAVIFHSTSGSRNIAGAERLVKDLISEAGLPVLSIETSLPGENIDPVKERIQGFLDSILSV